MAQKMDNEEKFSFEKVYNNVVVVVLTVHWAPNAGRTYRVCIVAISFCQIGTFLCILWFFFMYFLLSNKKLQEKKDFIFTKYIYSLNILFYFV